VNRQARAHAAERETSDAESDVSDLVASGQRMTYDGPKPPVAPDATSPAPPTASEHAFADVRRFERLAAEIAVLSATIEQRIDAGHVEPQLLVKLRRALHDARRLAVDAPGLAERFVALDAQATELVDRASAPKKLPDDVRGDLETATGHSLDHVRVHEDDVAAKHGARAVAIGSDIHVADGELGKPDVRALVAHEVAHVVQAKPRSEPTQAAAKRHADSTAAAEVDADMFAAQFTRDGAGTRWTPAVSISGAQPMRKAEGDEKFSDAELAKAARTHANITAQAYVHLHAHDIAEAVAIRQSTRVATGDPQVRFADSNEDLFLKALFKAFDHNDGATFVRRLREWISPIDLSELVDRNRPIFTDDKPQEIARDTLDYRHGPKGPPTLVAAVSIALGAAVNEQLNTSLARMSRQLVAITAKHRASGTSTRVRRDELVASHRLDSEVARAMIGEDEPTVTVTGEPLVVDTAAAHLGFRTITKVEWQGKRGGPWNAVSVEPAEAGPEAVAYHLLGSSTQAHRIRRVGPYFLIPEEDAIKFGEAAQFRVSGRHDQVDQLAFGATANTVESAEVERAMSGRGTQPAPTAAQLMHSAERIRDQLNALAIVVRPYGLDAALGPAHMRLGIHMTDLPALTGKDALVRGELFAKQTALLATIASQIGALTTTAKTAAGMTAADPRRQALERLVHAAALSHLPETGAAVLAEANSAQRDVVTERLEATLGQAATQIELVRTTSDMSRGARGNSEQVFGQSLAERADELRKRLADLRAHLLANQVAPNEVENLLRDIDALRFEATVVAEIGRLGEVFAAVRELEKSGWVQVSEAITAKVGEGERLAKTREGAMLLRRELNLVHRDWLQISQAAQTVAAQFAAGGVTDAEQHARAMVVPRMEAIRAKLQTIGSDERVNAFLSDAIETIGSAEFRAKVLQIAAMVGAAVATGGTGRLVGAGLKALGVGELGVALGALATETVSFTALQAALTGEPLLDAFRANAIGNLLTFGSVAAARKLLDKTRVGRTIADAAAGKKVRAAALLAAKTTVITVETLVGFGVQIAQAELESYTATGKTLSTEQALEVGAQGMAMIVGAAIGHRMFAKPLAKLHKLGGDLGARLSKVIGHAHAVEASHSTTDAIALMTETRAYIEAESKRAAELAAKSDAELAALGLTRGDVEALAKQAHAHAAALDHVDTSALAAQLGLHAIVPGRVFEGDARAVAAVEADYRARGYTVEHDGDRVRITKPGEAPIDVFVRPSQEALPPTGHTPHGQDAPTGLGKPSTDRILEKVPGTTYEQGGTFRIPVEHGTIEVTIRRTNGPARIVREGDRFVAEIPRGLVGPELEHAIVEQLQEAKAHAARKEPSPKNTTTKSRTPEKQQETPHSPDSQVAPSHAAAPPELRSALPPDVADVPIVRGEGLEGTGARVRYENGELVFEVGPKVEPRHIRGHVETARILRGYRGVVGGLRRLLSRLLHLLRIMPGYGSEGFEARVEVKKLRGQIADVERLQRALNERLAQVSRDGGHGAEELSRLAVERETLIAELAEHEASVDSFEAGRGYIAAERTPEHDAARARADQLAAEDPVVAVGLGRLRDTYRRGADDLLLQAGDNVRDFLRLWSRDDVFPQQEKMMHATLAREPALLQLAREYGVQLFARAWKAARDHGVPFESYMRRIEHEVGGLEVAERQDAIKRLVEARDFERALPEFGPDGQVIREGGQRPPRQRVPRRQVSPDRLWDSADPMYAGLLEEQRAAATKRGETIENTPDLEERLKRRAGLDLIRENARRGLFRGWTHEQRVAVLDAYDALGRTAWNPSKPGPVNSGRGELAEIMFLPEGAVANRGPQRAYESGKQVSGGNRKGTTKPDYTIPGDPVEFVNMKSDYLLNEREARERAQDYADFASEHEIPNLPANTRFSLHFVRDPGPNIRKVMIEEIFKSGRDHYCHRVRFGEKWYGANGQPIP
jgi:hypothetical protein